MAFVPRPRAILIDVGFTLLYCDGPTIAAIVPELHIDPEALHRVEPIMHAELPNHHWPLVDQGAPPLIGGTPMSLPQGPPPLIGGSIPADVPAPKDGGPRFFRRFLELAQVEGDLDDAAARIWASHLQNNVWRRAGAGVMDALIRLRAAGIKTAAVSNSEGTVRRLLDDVGMGAHLDTVIDSWEVGLTKPDPRIFELALARLGVGKDDAVMVGDSLKADVHGALAAGLRAALIDPHDLHRDAPAPRYRDFASFVDAVLTS